MNQNFDKAFQMAITESCSECIDQNRKEDSQYQQWDQEVGKLYNCLTKKLGEEGNLVIQFQEAQMRCTAIEEDWIYRQGFQDCLFLLTWAGVFE